MSDVPEILVVDDDAAIRRLFRHHLERAGLRVREADSGAAALDAIRQAPPSLVLLDYLMPDMDGPEVTREIRFHWGASFPVVLVTASNEGIHIEAAFAAGADDYITKPVDPRILTARVRSTLQAREDRRRALGADRMVAEMVDAQRVQVAELPELPAHLHGWTITGDMNPCAMVGGDTYAIVSGARGATALLVDVSGHGTSAALVASAISGSLGSLLLTRPIEEAMTALNLQLLGGRSGKYACVGAVAVDDDGAWIINAGLPPIALIVNGEVVAQIAASGPPPGLVGPFAYEAVRVPVDRGQHIAIMSDGLTEPFGMADDILPALRGLGLLDGAVKADTLDLTARVAALVQGSGHEDDATVLVLWRDP